MYKKVTFLNATNYIKCLLLTKKYLLVSSILIFYLKKFDTKPEVPNYIFQRFSQ